MYYFQAIALTKGDKIKGYVWQSLLSIWAFMLVCGMAGLTPALLPFFLYQSMALAAIVIIDHYATDEGAPKEIILVWAFMLISVFHTLKGF
jgi:hypothetical protein